MRLTCTRRAGPSARSVASWAFTGARLANSSRAPASPRVRAVLPLIPPPQSGSWSCVTSSAASGRAEQPSDMGMFLALLLVVAVIGTVGSAWPLQQWEWLNVRGHAETAGKLEDCNSLGPPPGERASIQGLEGRSLWNGYGQSGAPDEDPSMGSKSLIKFRRMPGPKPHQQ
jgi:hypothetical protein